jgi:hypothetical protein
MLTIVVVLVALLLLLAFLYFRGILSHTADLSSHESLAMRCEAASDSVAHAFRRSAFVPGRV